MGLKTLYCATVFLCVLGSLLPVYSTERHSGRQSEPNPPLASSQKDESQLLKGKQVRSLSENCPFECDCNPGTLQCSESVTRGSLTEVPDRLGSYPEARQAKTLNFEGGLITKISDGDFLGLSQAETLNLRHNRLKVVTPAAFQGLNSLRQLFLDYNKIEELSAGVLDPLANLKVLDLSHNELTLDDPEDTPFLTSHGLQHIQTLNLSNNAIQKIWEYTLVGLEHLTTLILDDNPLQGVQPDVFAQLPRLEELSLVDVDLPPEVILRELRNLPNLKRIHLGNGRDPCNCAWVRVKARLRRQGVVLVEPDGAPECRDGGLSVCVTAESSDARIFRKDNAPRNDKAPPVVKLSWKSVSYGAPSKKHSSPSIPRLEKAAKRYGPTKTTPSQLMHIVKDRLLRTESKESVSSETDTLPWWNANKMKAPAQNELNSNMASEKSPPIFPWWHPQYVRTSMLHQVFKMMKLPVFENDIEKEKPSTTVLWWHPDYVRLDSKKSAHAQEFPFGSQKHPTFTGFNKSPASQKYGMLDRIGHRNGDNRAKSRREGYANVLKSLYGSPNRNRNYLQPELDELGRSRLQASSRSRPAIHRPPYKYEYHKPRGMYGYSPRLSSHPTRYGLNYPNKYQYGKDHGAQHRHVQYNSHQKDVSQDRNIKHILTGIKEMRSFVGGRNMHNAVESGRKTGRYEQTSENYHGHHGSRGGNEWLYDIWKKTTSERHESERGSHHGRQHGIQATNGIAMAKQEARLPFVHRMEEETMEDDFERLREKVRKLKTKVHHMEELEEERKREHHGKKPKNKGREAPPDSRERKYMVPILLPLSCIVVVLVIAFVVKTLNSRRQGAPVKQTDDHGWLSKFTKIGKKAKKKVKKPIWAMGRGAKQLKTNRKQAMSLSGDQEDSEDEELFDVKKEEPSFKAYRKSRS
ncbi:PREDICTED: uncharacterized protein LOC109478852 [Branchiostoma belcheri]|uniref:Uncharacterized protein LOC109478852 n=1 Tax=Branchiostoma belcheri TaxID=7741 RepID=A0A6P4ZHJ0_BRABE|nr:PREDICTED: uncharacterized protein LOC109478852 [Branchiostoma belcheri]